MQSKSMNQIGLTWSGGHEHTPTAFERLATGSLVGVRQVSVQPCFRRCRKKDLSQRPAHDFVTSFPDHQRARIRPDLRQRNSHDEGMRLTQHSLS